MATVFARQLRRHYSDDSCNFRLLLAVALVVSLTASFACTRKPLWRSSDVPDAADAEVVLTAMRFSDLYRDPDASELPDVPIRKKLRPCCAFGAGLGAKAGGVPVPVYRIGNILGPEGVGPHTYDSGVFHLQKGELQRNFLNNEKNGLVYTCRGGFIDTAHVRDYADWGAFVGARIARHLATGTTIELPDEGGRRTIVLKPIPTEVLDRYSPVMSSVVLAQLVIFEISVWHEIATWFGWSSMPAFPEKVSAFSPEDLYSNLTGVKIGAVIGYRRGMRDEGLYNLAVTNWLDQVLVALQAVPSQVGRDAMRAVDGHWWDSSKRLPDPTLVTRRALNIEAPIEPWLVPTSRAPASVREHCGDHPEPLPLSFRTEAVGFKISDYVTLRVEVDDKLAAQRPFTELGRVVTQEDFPAIVAAIRAQNLAEFGADADRPD